MFHDDKRVPLGLLETEEVDRIKAAVEKVFSRQMNTIVTDMKEVLVPQLEEEPGGVPMHIYASLVRALIDRAKEYSLAVTEFTDPNSTYEGNALNYLEMLTDNNLLWIRKILSAVKSEIDSGVTV